MNNRKILILVSLFSISTALCAAPKKQKESVQHKAADFVKNHWKAAAAVYGVKEAGKCILFMSECTPTVCAKYSLSTILKKDGISIGPKIGRAFIKYLPNTYVNYLKPMCQWITCIV